MAKKVLIATGGGDCPGLNAVIRAIVKLQNIMADGRFTVPLNLLTACSGMK